MYRNMPLLAEREYDLLVIGGGIYGACVAWDASLRGLSVALVEKGDFGGATSANSLKIIHGGLRYLQDLNLQRMRLMIQERRTWMHIAPQLVRPLPCVMPTGKKLSRHKLTMAAALSLNDLISHDRNIGVSPQHRLGNGRILSQAEFNTLIPGDWPDKVTGGALWYDAQILNSERLLLSILQSAVEHGATIANYVDVTGFEQDGNRLRSVTARDQLTGNTYTLSARTFVNCTGGWSDSLLAKLEVSHPPRTFYLSTAMNLVTRQILPDFALGLPSRYAGKERILFIAPWQGYSLIGTWHEPHDAMVPGYQIDEAVIQRRLDEINLAYPAAALSRNDVHHVQVGYLPALPTATANKVKLVRESQIHDHAKLGGPEALITVSGVKYTTALHTAAQVVDSLLRKLSLVHVPSPMRETMVTSKEYAANEFRSELMTAARTRIAPKVSDRLSSIYGRDAAHMIGHLDEDTTLSRPLAPAEEVLRVEVIHGVRCEMAQTLADVVRRRTPLGAVSPPSRATAIACAQLMGNELGWSHARQSAEIDALYDSYPVYTRNKNGDI